MVEVPLSFVAPVRLSDDAPNGIFLSHKPSDPTMLTFNWGGKVHAMHLEGERAFTHFTISAGYSARGTLISKIEFIVDLSSRYDALEKSDPIGSLILQDGELFVIGKKAGDSFGEPHEVPLWGEYDHGTAEQKVGFANWSIVIQDGDERKTIWSKGAADGAAAS